METKKIIPRVQSLHDRSGTLRTKFGFDMKGRSIEVAISLTDLVSRYKQLFSFEIQIWHVADLFSKQTAPLTCYYDARTGTAMIPVARIEQLTKLAPKICTTIAKKVQDHIRQMHKDEWPQNPWKGGRLDLPKRGRITFEDTKIGPVDYYLEVEDIVRINHHEVTLNEDWFVQFQITQNGTHGTRVGTAYVVYRANTHYTPFHILSTIGVRFDGNPSIMEHSTADALSVSPMSAAILRWFKQNMKVMDSDDPCEAPISDSLSVATHLGCTMHIVRPPTKEDYLKGAWAEVLSFSLHGSRLRALSLEAVTDHKEGATEWKKVKEKRDALNMDLYGPRGNEDEEGSLLIDRWAFGKVEVSEDMMKQLVEARQKEANFLAWATFDIDRASHPSVWMATINNMHKASEEAIKLGPEYFERRTIDKTAAEVLKAVADIPVKVKLEGRGFITLSPKDKTYAWYTWFVDLYTGALYCRRDGEDISFVKMLKTHDDLRNSTPSKDNK